MGKPSKGRLRGAQRRRKVERATPGWLTKEQYFQLHGIYCRAKHMNRVWRAQNAESVSRHRNHYSVDHIIPLDGQKVCGLHVPWNLRIIERAVDNRKGNTFSQQEESPPPAGGFQPEGSQPIGAGYGDALATPEETFGDSPPG